MPAITTLQIAQAKEKFLERALDVISPVVDNGDKIPVSLEKDVENLAQDAINLFTDLLRCDEQHNLLASTSDDETYLKIEEELAALFQRFSAMCHKLWVVGQTLQQKGTPVKSQRELETVCAQARRLIESEPSFYDTHSYQILAERAESEYRAGQVEEWP